MLRTIPFKDKLICATHIVSEIGFLFYACSLFFFLSEELESGKRLYLGSIIVWGLIILMGVIWLMFIAHIIKLFIHKRRQRKEKKLLEEEENETQLKTELELEEKSLKEKRDKIKERLANTRNRAPVVISLNLYYI